MSKCMKCSDEFVNKIKNVVRSYGSCDISDIKVYYDASVYNKRDYVLNCTVNNWNMYKTKELKERMKENFEIFDFELGAEDMELITTLDRKTSSFFDHCDPAIIKWMGERKLDI